MQVTSRSLIAVLSLVVIAVQPQRARAADAAATLSRPLPPQLDDTVARGLDFLARQQNPDGSLASGKNPDGTPVAAAAPPLATTGLTVIALLSAGHTPDVGRYGHVLRSAIDHLLAKIPDNGYIGAPSGDKGDASHMYGQAIVTFALAEACGVEHAREKRTLIRGALTKLLGVILAAQAVEKSEVHSGGWGPAPNASDSDLLLSGWNVLALVACHEAGFNVPREATQRAAQYVMKCRNPLDKGFAYQPGAPGQASTTGSALVILRLLGAGEKRDIADSQQFLAQAGAQPPTRSPYETMYNTIHGAQGSEDAAWTACSRPIFDALLKAQLPDGGWPVSSSPEEPGRIHATAMAVMTLCVPYRLLPIYQN